MKDQKFLIKISDLLNETGKSDEISFQNKTVEQLPDIDDQGIAGSLLLQSIGEDALLGTLSNIECTMTETCDSCAKSFTRKISIPEYKARFVIEGSLSKDEEEASDEAILFINEKDDTIDITDMVYQAILLNEPFVKRCADCEKRLASEDDEEDDLGSFSSGGNINFS